MKFYKLLLLLVFILIPIINFGQSISGLVISNGGQQEILTGGVILSWTIGETVVSSENQNAITNLGFHQGGLLITAIEKKDTFEENTNKWVVFPNPSSTYFTIQHSSTENLNEQWNYRLMDASGREVLQGQLENTSPFQQSVEHLAAGTYLLMLYSNSGKQQHFKLQHQHCFN